MQSRAGGISSVLATLDISRSDRAPAAKMEQYAQSARSAGPQYPFATSIPSVGAQYPFPSTIPQKMSAQPIRSPRGVYAQDYGIGRPQNGGGMQSPRTPRTPRGTDKSLTLGPPNVLQTLHAYDAPDFTISGQDYGPQGMPFHDRSNPRGITNYAPSMERPLTSFSSAVDRQGFWAAPGGMERQMMAPALSAPMQYLPSSAAAPPRFSAPPIDFRGAPSFGQSYSGPGPSLGQSYSGPGPSLGQSYSGPGPSLGQSFSGPGLGQSFPSGFRSITPGPLDPRFAPSAQQHPLLSPRSTHYEGRSREGYVPVLPGYRPVVQNAPQLDSDVDPDMFPEQYKRMLDAPTGSWFKAPTMSGRGEQTVSDVDIPFPSQRGFDTGMGMPQASVRTLFPDYVPGNMSVDFLRAPLVPTPQNSVQDSRPIWGPIPASQNEGMAPLQMRYPTALPGTSPTWTDSLIDNMRRDPGFEQMLQQGPPQHNSFRAPPPSSIYPDYSSYSYGGPQQPVREQAQYDFGLERESLFDNRPRNDDFSNREPQYPYGGGYKESSYQPAPPEPAGDDRRSGWDISSLGRRAADAMGFDSDPVEAPPARDPLPPAAHADPLPPSFVPTIPAPAHDPAPPAPAPPAPPAPAAPPREEEERPAVPAAASGMAGSTVLSAPPSNTEPVALPGAKQPKVGSIAARLAAFQKAADEVT